jgi:hypothetical protein
MILDGSGNQVSPNRWSRNADGIVVTGDGNTVVRITCRTRPAAQTAAALASRSRAGPAISSRANMVARAREAGIRVADFEPEGVRRRSATWSSGIWSWTRRSTAY